jgi:hypothetical protein
MKNSLIIFNFLFLVGCSVSPVFKSDNTIKENRIKFESQLKENIENNITAELTDENTEKFESTFWAMELMNYRSERIDTIIVKSFSKFSSISPSLQRAFLEVTYTLYPNEFQTEIRTILPDLKSPKNFAMAANYLIRNDTCFSYCEKYLNNFNDKDENPILLSLKNNLKQLKSKKTIQTPPIHDLLYHKLKDDYFYIYSFQRKNRDYRGITIVKNKDNKFIRNDDGSIFYIKHFARSITNLPGYITNGNTPQGVLSFQGFANSKNVFIGPTTNLQLGLPFEYSVKSFFHDNNLDNEWEIQLYRDLFPKSWQNYSPVFEAYYAGKAGRTEIIAHGSTINPEFYAGKIYYPYTPSQGCMTALEKWSEENGELIESDQLKLFEAVKRCNSDKGFLYLIELGDKNEDVRFDEISRFIDELF